MAQVKNIKEFGNQLALFYDDGTRAIAYPTQGGVWVVKYAFESGGGGGPVDPGPGGGQFSSPFAMGTPPEGGSVTSEYGPRTGGTGTFHEGIDFGKNGAVNGANIKCAGAGVVKFAGYNGAFGNSVRVFHGTFGEYDLWTTYNHMQDGSLAVSTDQSVAKGAVLGKLGNTGNSFGAHLHFETHRPNKGGGLVWNTLNNGNYRTAINPRDFMSAYGDGGTL